MYAVKHTQLLQFATPIQTERSDEVGYLLFLNYGVFFQCKNLNNIFSGPQITVQNKLKRHFMTPLSGHTECIFASKIKKYMVEHKVYR